MTKFQIVDNLEVPASAPRHRARGEFSQALDSLNIGQGFMFDDKRALKNLYPSVAPKKFPVGDGLHNKKFQLWAVPGETGKYGVKRLDNVAIKSDSDAE